MECLFHTESNNVAAYCKHHHCGITVKQMKAKKCLQKQCNYFVKNEQHDHWRQREWIKHQRKVKKNVINAYLNNVYNEEG